MYKWSVFIADRYIGKSTFLFMLERVGRLEMWDQWNSFITSYYWTGMRFVRTRNYISFYSYCMLFCLLVVLVALGFCTVPIRASLPWITPKCFFDAFTFHEIWITVYKSKFDYFVAEFESVFKSVATAKSKIYCPSVYPSVDLSIYLTICLSVYPSTKFVQNSFWGNHYATLEGPDIFSRFCWVFIKIS